jgi:8-oxo-dGTP pyrophosphatase MutT (NUDIX family)
VSVHSDPPAFEEINVPGEIDELRWLQHGERSLYDNDWVRLTLVDVTPPNGNRFEHHVVRLQRVVMSVVVDSESRVLLLWRHRFVTNSWGWELPGGIAEEGESPIETAVRETLEETGWKTRSLEKLIEFQPMPGMVDTPHEVFLSLDAVHVGEPSDPEEASIVRWIPIAEIPSLIERGLISGAGSLIGLMELLRRGVAERDGVQSPQ